MDRIISVTTPRIDVADVLRGFAVAGIIILHSLEHFGFYSFPEQPAWNQQVWDATFFLLSNKMYAIFAMLFGLSFFIQFDNQDRRRMANPALPPFGPRFAWRMAVLFGWGMLNLVFFNGDILTIYAMGGLLLIPFMRMTTRTVAGMAVLMALQPVELYNLLASTGALGIEPLAFDPWSHFGAMNPGMADGTLWQSARLNWRHGIAANALWALEHGRLTQTFGYFLLGLLVGRARLLADLDAHIAFWRRTGAAAVAAFVLILPLWLTVPGLIADPVASKSVGIMLDAWKNLAMVWTMISAIVLLYQRTDAGRRLLTPLALYGRTSLTNYMTSSVIGGLLFFGWGVAHLHDITHAQSLAVGVGIVLFQMLMSHMWLRRHARGPLEELWRRATWLFK